MHLKSNFRRFLCLSYWVIDKYTKKWAKDLLSMAQPIRTRPSFPLVSLSHWEASISLLFLYLLSSTLAWKIPWTEEPGRLHGVTRSRTWLSDVIFLSFFFGILFLYSTRLYFHHQSHPQLGVVFTLILSLHSFWSYFSTVLQ